MEGGTIWCYTCKHRRQNASEEYDPYCEKYCGDAWQGYEREDDEEPEEMEGER